MPIEKRQQDAVFGYFYAYMDVGKGREHDCKDAGGSATQEAKAEERKLWREKSYLRTYVQDVR